MIGQLAVILAPPRCLNCLTENTWLCHACAASFASPKLASGEHRRVAPPLAGITSAGSYSQPAYKRLVGWLKFKGVRALAPLAAALIADHLAAIAPLATLQADAVLVPIPLHPHKARQRGFNQTIEIAKSLSEQTGIPLANLLTRQQSTWTQSQLPHELRQENVASAFTLAAPLPTNKKYFLLIDDVATTGATLQAAAHAIHSSLRQAQGKHIWGCVVAQG